MILFFCVTNLLGEASTQEKKPVCLTKLLTILSGEAKKTYELIEEEWSSSRTVVQKGRVV